MQPVEFEDSMRDQEHLIFGAPFLLSGQQRWSRRSGSPADSGSMLALNVAAPPTESIGLPSRLCSLEAGNKIGSGR